MRSTLCLLALMMLPGAASAQRRPPVAPVLVGIDALRADLLAKAGTDTVYFGAGGVDLGPPAKAVLAAQAQWFLAHPEVVARIEGYADANDTRDHALAIGASRAEQVRNYLILLGVPAVQLSTVSWGKERPGIARAVTVLVR
jgi:peptidoglycan-associated lipoprotein